VIGRLAGLACALLALVCAPIGAGARADGEDDDEGEEERLQERLTEREDKRRPLEPFRIHVGGHPLTLGGEYETELAGFRPRVLDRGVDQPDRLLLEQGLQLEAFFTLGQPLSLFVQLRGVMEEDLLGDTVDEVSDVFVERQEMWLYSENILGSHLNLDVGRLHFEDERRWWWDDELDAARIAYERDTFEIELSVARELGPDRSDRSYVDPEQERVLRLIGEASWNWSPSHAFELFLLHQDDTSSTESPGQVVRTAREDDEDARLTWLGARATGVLDARALGLLGYWLDVAGVRGRQHRIDFEDLTARRAVVDEVVGQDVAGWAFDAGTSWLLPLPFEPRLYLGYAFGSGDSRPDSRTDRSFQQTHVQANEAGFGGYERFQQYGFLLDPELSNLGIATIGAGISFLRSSSLDLVYHHYRLIEPTNALRDARLEAELDEVDRGVGDGIDLVLVLEEWERLELELVASAFRTGSAFEDRPGTWCYGGLFVTRFAF
jgi:hypothetical protein